MYFTDIEALKNCQCLVNMTCGFELGQVVFFFLPLYQTSLPKIVISNSLRMSSTEQGCYVQVVNTRNKVFITTEIWQPLQYVWNRQGCTLQFVDRLYPLSPIQK